MSNAIPTPTNPNISDVVKRLIDLTKRQREVNREAKIIRDDIGDLKALVIAHMQKSSIEVCRVSHAGKDGEIALRKAQRTRALKKCDAVTHMAKWLQQEVGMQMETSVDKAEALWDDVQKSRECMEVVDLSVRKLV